MDRFAELSIFLAVVETGSFSSAARLLRLSPSAISKAITRQENRLGVRLFNRNSRMVRPTAEGAALYESGHAVRDAMEAAEASVSASGSVPAGTLRVHSMPMLAKYLLAPMLPDFLARYPQVRLDFDLAIERLDPVMTGADVIVRTGTWRGSNLVTRRIGTARRIVCASPDYLRRHGVPRVPEDLLGHNCIARRAMHDWAFVEDGKPGTLNVAGNVTVNESELLLTLVKAGVGIMRFSEHVVAPDIAAGTLVPLLTEFEADTAIPVYVAYQNRRLLHPRVRAFVDFLCERFAERRPAAENGPGIARRNGERRASRGNRARVPDAVRKGSLHGGHGAAVDDVFGACDRCRAIGGEEGDR